MIDVVVITYEARKHVQQCLLALDGRPPNVKVFVLDNASQDGTYDWLQQWHAREDIQSFTLMQARQNIGFARAANYAASLGSGEFVLFLNPDINFPQGWDWLDHLAEAVSQKEVGAASPLLRGTQGNYWPGSEEWVTGACMMVRREVWQKLKGFDPKFFFGYEDHDFCNRLREQGFSIVVTDDVLVHEAFQSPRDWGTGLYHPASELRYYQKWRQGKHKVRGQDFGSVAISTTLGRWIYGSFLVHWSNLITHGQREGDAIIYPDTTSLVHWTRNAIVCAFLSQCDCDTLLWVDTDMAVDASMLDDLRDNPANWDYDIVSGLCTSRAKNPEALLLRQVEVPYPKSKLGAHFTRGDFSYTPGDTVEVDGTGMAFTLVRRSVYEAMLDPDGWGTTFFYEFPKRQGEDVTFCLKARELGFKVGVDTGVTPGHYTEVPVNATMLYKES
jgi:hypothetical protein